MIATGHYGDDTRAHHNRNTHSPGTRIKIKSGILGFTARDGEDGESKTQPETPRIPELRGLPLIQQTDRRAYQKKNRPPARVWRERAHNPYVPDSSVDSALVWGSKETRKPENPLHKHRAAQHSSSRQQTLRLNFM